MAHVDTAVRFIITALFSGLWQAPVFALAAWLVLRVRPNLNATTRHSVLAAALFASLVLPLVTAAVTANTVAAAPVQTTLSRGTSDAFVPSNILPYKPGKLGATVPSRTNPAAETPSPLLAVPSLDRLNLALPRVVALAIVSIWVLGAGFVLLRLIISLSHLERLKRDALPLPVEYRAELTRWAAASKGSRTVRLCMSEEIEIPIAVGLFDAMILVPARLLEELAPADVDSIVLHELAHLRRSDDWVNAIERFTQAFLFFNPGVSWLCGQLDLEREVACDDWVLLQNDALPYATCLARVVETTVWPYRAMTAPGAFVTRRGMSIRIERLLSKHRDVRVHTSFGPAGAVVGMLAVLGIVAAVVSPSIAYSVVQVADPAVTTITVTNRGTHTKTVIVSSTREGDTQRAGDRHAGGRQATTTIDDDALATREAAAETARHDAENAERKLAARSAHEAETIVSLTNAARDAHNSEIAKHHEHAHEGTGSHSASTAATASSYGQDYSYSYDSYPDTHPDVHANSNPYPHPNVTVRIAPIAPIAPDVPAIKNLRRPEIVAEANAPDYIDQLASVGYTSLTVDELIQMKAVGVTASFIRELQQQGFQHLSVSELVEYRAAGCDPAYVGSMRKRFGSSISIDDVVGMRAVGVTPEYIDALAAIGYKNLSADRLKGLRALGVTPAYVSDLTSLGYTNLTVDQIQQFRALGIDREFIAHAASHGFHNLTVQQLINLKATGVL